MRFLRTPALCALVLLANGRADVRGCLCDVARPETMEARECSLCAAVESMPPTAEFVAIRDKSPNKPNRWLVLPRAHGKEPQDLLQMSPEMRTKYWRFAIAKAQELWGDQWGLAVNSVDRRTQCHMHVHIGKLPREPEGGTIQTVSDPAEIKPPNELDGVLVHPVKGKLELHYGDNAPELLLER